ncbi:MAG: PTS sugar transporter subunit IIA [Sphaerochaetaceae bacterium]|nr:PTS sugar transporter subunit IIA [Sphaerochaetaceae bacterium]
MTLTDILDRDLIKVPLEGRSKHEIIEELVDLLSQKKALTNREEILSAVLERESLGSTGLADGIAIPHAKTAAVDRVYLVVGLADTSVDFDAQDGEGSLYFFLVLAPEHEASAHIEILSSIAKTTASASFKRLLRLAKTSEDVYSLFID